MEATRTILSNFSTHQKETKNERAFKAMDANGDGFVTRAEFKKACKALKPEQVIIRFRRGLWIRNCSQIFSFW